MAWPVNSIVQQDRLRREFGTVGGYKLNLAETVSPVAVVSDLTVGQEVSRAAIGGIRHLSAVGQRATFSFFTTVVTPLSQLYALVVSTDTTQNFDLGTGGAVPGAGAFSVTFQDRRIGFIEVPTGRGFAYDLAAAPAGGVVRIPLRLGANAMHIIPVDFLLGAEAVDGTTFTPHVWLQAGATNNTVNCSFLWRESPRASALSDPG